MEGSSFVTTETRSRLPPLVSVWFGPENIFFGVCNVKLFRVERGGNLDLDRTCMVCRVSASARLKAAGYDSLTVKDLKDPTLGDWEMSSLGEDVVTTM